MPHKRKRETKEAMALSYQAASEAEKAAEKAVVTPSGKRRKDELKASMAHRLAADSLWTLAECMDFTVEESLSHNLSANQLMQDKLKLWKRTALSALEVIFENKEQQINIREICLEQIGEQSANLTQLSIRDDADEDEVKDCENDLSRLNTAFKTSGTLLEHIAAGIVKILNEKQPMPLCSFSRSVKTGGISSAKATDFSVKLNDEALGVNTKADLRV